jgi:hypothetical protein
MNNGEVTGNKASGGGGIYISGNASTINGGEISNNEASDGGGLYLAGNSKTTMYGGVIKNNKATNRGGGIAINHNSDQGWSQTDFIKEPAAGSLTSGTIYGATAGNGLANTANSGSAIHTIHWYSTSRRDRTIGEFENFSRDAGEWD